MFSKKEFSCPVCKTWYAPEVNEQCPVCNTLSSGNSGVVERIEYELHYHPKTDMMGYRNQCVSWIICGYIRSMAKEIIRYPEFELDTMYIHPNFKSNFINYVLNHRTFQYFFETNSERIALHLFEIFEKVCRNIPREQWYTGFPDQSTSSFDNYM